LFSSSSLSLSLLAGRWSFYSLSLLFWSHPLDSFLIPQSTLGKNPKCMEETLYPWICLLKKRMDLMPTLEKCDGTYNSFGLWSLPLFTWLLDPLHSQGIGIRTFLYLMIYVCLSSW
jgi:hypothetical protein